MSENINLLSKNRVQNATQQRLLLLCKRLSIFSLLVTAGTSLLFFILTFSPILSNVKEQENTLLQNLNFSEKKIAKYLFVKDRITAAENIIKTRYPVNNLISTIQQQLPEDVHIETIDIEKKTLALKVSSPNLDHLNTALDNITALLHTKKMFRDILLQNIATDNVSQVYSLSLQANLL